jgi:hypothetical protein
VLLLLEAPLAVEAANTPSAAQPISNGAMTFQCRSTWRIESLPVSVSSFSVPCPSFRVGTAGWRRRHYTENAGRRRARLRAIRGETRLLALVFEQLSQARERRARSRLETSEGNA